MKIIGISGLARSGKDSFYSLAKDQMGKNKKVSRLAFADELKEECNDFLTKNIGISPFTEASEEKKIIRPFLVTYGTHLRRKLNKRCWIDKVEDKLKRITSDYVFITDVRYKNEIDWIHELEGESVHIERKGNIPPNKEEEENDPLLKTASTHKVLWENFSEENMDIMSSHVKRILEKI